MTYEISPEASETNLFELLNKLDQRNLNIWNKLPDHEQKKVPIYSILRWMAGTKNQNQIIALNNFVNCLLFPLKDHPELLMKLLALSGSGQHQNYKYIPPAKDPQHSPSGKIISEYYGIPQRQARLAQSLYSRQDIITMAGELGWQKEELKVLLKENEK